MYIYTHLYIYVYIYIYMYVCVYIYIYIHMAMWLAPGLPPVKIPDDTHQYVVQVSHMSLIWDIFLANVFLR